MYLNGGLATNAQISKKEIEMEKELTVESCIRQNVDVILQQQNAKIRRNY
jgi:hypothetical protein